jgi:DNA-binding CsgD family transcriptional regulator
MFDLLDVRSPAAPAASSVPPARGAAPRRPSTRALDWRWLAAMLDEVDYGMLLLLDGHYVAHANHVARGELDADHPLQLLGSELRARHEQDVAELHAALCDAAERGLRRLLTLGTDQQRISVAVVPLGPVGGENAAGTLLTFGKRQVCADLSVQGYARCHKLTQAEVNVLRGLCRGERPSEIAQRQAVAISTVRTQISSIRQKTGADSLRSLVRQVAVLPPLVSALRNSRAAGDACA